MRRFFLGASIIFGLSSTSAQLHLGAKTGANLAKIDSESFDDRFKLGYQLGGFAYYDFSNSLGLQVEVQFNQSNTKVEERYSSVLTNTFDRGKRLNYVSVPVLLRINSSGLITFVGGPQFSFLANGEEGILDNSKRLFKKTDFGMVAGAEINFRPLFIYARYIWGFSSISDIGDKAHSRQIQLGLGVKIF
ncbi:Outer membrane protein beta-barrel domain-containing protein [Chryseobacterium soldanellicola]|uniref:Outer membrane protein beta-barrel domain-containing protein n=1 Tax=Chryseobacterium soldanellicola TaxID=311333 RepID=A0A1H1FCH0_9FLAO|nr:porin family protein [Chryseobacterium soldanellicola]SDQ98617.1 Outer membrane protein beta-barrel domain-containing protein [Chryseobacterium soldanellicola]